MIVNLTPHPVTVDVYDQHGKCIGSATYKPAKESARLSEEWVEDGILLITDSDPPAFHACYKVRHGDIVGLPKYKAKDGVRSIYVVSKMVFDAAKRNNPDRKDLCFPCKCYRDGEGNIAGAHGLCFEA